MKICIVGGGLVGLSASISLSNALQKESADDFEITLVEKHDFSSRGFWFGLEWTGSFARNMFVPPARTQGDWDCP
jgi:2-polyprenyl-6-methoxyphenol hydroxylase-like FAD-dependent oxidoreductase